MKNSRVQIELKRGSRAFTVVSTIERVPRQHAGWESITFDKRRYQLHGGIRNPLFINLDNPIRGKHHGKRNG